MVRGGGKAVTGGYLGVVIKNPILVPAFTAVLVMDDDDDDVVQ